VSSMVARLTFKYEAKRIKRCGNLMSIIIVQKIINT
jgi:hypothetical protein